LKWTFQLCFNGIFSYIPALFQVYFLLNIFFFQFGHRSIPFHLSQKEHDIRLAVPDQFRNLRILLMDNQGCLRQIGPGKFFIDSAGIHHDLKFRFIDIVQTLELADILVRQRIVLPNNK
jgi:hypothetical protein